MNIGNLGVSNAMNYGVEFAKKNRRNLSPSLTNWIIKIVAENPLKDPSDLYPVIEKHLLEKWQEDDVLHTIHNKDLADRRKAIREVQQIKELKELLVDLGRHEKLLALKQQVEEARLKTRKRKETIIEIVNAIENLDIQDQKDVIDQLKRNRKLEI